MRFWVILLLFALEPFGFGNPAWTFASERSDSRFGGSGECVRLLKRLFAKNDDFNRLSERYSEFEIQESIWHLRAEGHLSEATKLELSLEKALSEGEIVSHETLDIGTTEPRLVRYRNGISGVFKWNSRDWGDSYQAEIAAYRLDRLLGLDLVPVTVTRQYSGKSGSVQYFIARPSKWKSRKTSSRLNYFDYLIANPDRNSRGNYLIFPGRPYEIAVDHGKAFSTDSLYSEIENLKSITPPKEDFQRLKKLEDDEIRATLTGILPKSKIEGVIRRKRLLIQAIEKAIRSGKSPF